MLSNDCGRPWRIKVYLTHGGPGPHNHKSNQQPHAHQLNCMLAPSTTSSAVVNPAYMMPTQEVVHMRGIGPYTVNLTLNTLNAVPGMNGRVLGLVEVPEDLRLVKETVCELNIHCFALLIVPEWVGELVHLQVLHLDGELSKVISNRALTEMPEALGSLHYLQSLTLKNLECLRTLPASIVTLTSLKTLHIERCWLENLPIMGAMPALRSLTLCDALETLPTCLGEFDLCYLMLGNFKQVDNLPGICERLTSLETLHIEGCAALQKLPTMSLTSLTSLMLDKCELMELPCIKSLTAMRHLSLSNLINVSWFPCLGGMSTLQHLSLVNLWGLLQLPSSISQLTNLRELRLVRLNRITELPSMCDMRSLEVLRICCCYELNELPARMDALTALHTLELEYLNNLKEPDDVSSSILELTALTELTLTDSWLTDVSFIESFTNLRSLTICVREAGIVTLACALPALRLLQYLSINSHNPSNYEVVVICCALKAWPLPFLSDIDYWRDIGKICCKELSMQPESAGWTNTAVLQHWRVQQHKVFTFGSGLHHRLGVASQVSSLNETVFVLIADEVLGCFSLIWERERLLR